MAKLDNTPPATMEELLVSSFAAADALAKLLIDKKLITEQEYLDRLSQERGLYQKILERLNMQPDWERMILRRRIA